MIETQERTVRLYFVLCDKAGPDRSPCRNRGPTGRSRIEALEEARHEGWDITSRWNGLAHVHMHVCPTCVAKEDEACAPKEIE